MSIVITPHVHETYRAGQRWRYKTRPSDATSTALIIAVDEYAGQIVINVSLDEILVGSPATPMSVVAPIHLDQLHQSVTTLVDEGHDVAQLDQGLEEWRSLVRESKAGYFTTSLSAIAERIASQRK